MDSINTLQHPSARQGQGTDGSGNSCIPEKPQRKNQNALLPSRASCMSPALCSRGGQKSPWVDGTRALRQAAQGQPLVALHRHIPFWRSPEGSQCLPGRRGQGEEEEPRGPGAQGMCLGARHAMVAYLLCSRPAPACTHPSFPPQGSGWNLSQCARCSPFMCFFFFHVYFFLRERQNVSRGGAEREGDTETKNPERLQALSRQHRARRRARTHKP